MDDCPILHPMIQNDRHNLQRWHCVFTGSIPKVCCPPMSEWANFPSYGIDNNIKPISSNTFGGSATKPFQGVGERDLFNNGKIISGEENVCGYDTSNSNKITGGGPAAVDEYPWLVLLEYNGGGLLCGGSLISSTFVLTAAHCLSGINGFPIAARLGEYNTTSEPIDYVQTDGGGYENVTVTIIDVKTVIVHPSFDAGRKIHDIGLVKLKQRVIFTDFIKIICLPARNYMSAFSLKTNFTVAGWGDTRDANDKYKDVKKHTTVPYVAQETCARTWSRLSADSQICAGGKDGKDTCEGDSGGPLMYYVDDLYLVVGITSYGHRMCGTDSIPAVYTNVFKYLNWILDYITERVTV